ncbi:hypothetical protein C8J57DRAFT_1330658 [Mycena rebaudengoi]|nr:hypothetical protein C8J57DRAFT_1330658 [Mycena rebaudengoi]
MLTSSLTKMGAVYFGRLIYCLTPSSVDGPLSMSVPPINLQPTYGSLLIGCFLSSVIWGISCLQLFIYFLIYNQDHWKLQLIVAFLFLMDTANQILVIKSVWPPLILEWGRIEVLAKSEGTLELIHHVWVSAIVSVGVQLFFVRRIYVFSGSKKWFSCLLVLLSSWQIIGLAPYNYLVFGRAPISAGKQSEQLTAVSVSTRASAAAVDMLIAVSMVYLLLTRIPEPSTHFIRTRKLIFRLVLVSVNSGAWTAILALLDLVSIVAFPTAFTFCIFELPLCPLYMCTLLANLNARKWLDPQNQKTPSLRASRADPSIFFLNEFSPEASAHSLSDGSVLVRSEHLACVPPNASRPGIV